MSFNPLSMFTPDWAAIGTGLKPLNDESTATLGELPESILEIIKPKLPTLFGDYPVDSGETAGDAVFIAVYSILTLANLFVFIKDWTRGHRFWPMLGLACYSILLVIGFALRLKWADNFMNVPMGVAAVVFTQTPIMVLEVLNFYFSTRVFTWRHPDAGRSCFQRSYNGVIYFIIIGIIIMAILGSAIPNLYYLTPQALKRCQQCAQAASILQIVYSINSMLNVLNAYTLRPGKLGKKLFWGEKPNCPENYPNVRQANWIQSFGVFHYPDKQKRKFYKDDGDYGHHVLATSNSPGGGLVKRHEGYEETRGSMGINVFIIFVTAILLLICSIFRCIAMFMTGERGGDDETPFKSVVLRSYIMFIFYGGFGALINIFWLIMRVDLRFYQPDRPKKRKSGDPPARSDFFDNNSVEKGHAGHEESI